MHVVARELIGCRLLYKDCAGTIVETESYEGDDPACHAYVGLTKRTEVLFGAAGSSLCLSVLRNPQPAECRRRSGGQGGGGVDPGAGANRRPAPRCGLGGEDVAIWTFARARAD